MTDLRALLGERYDVVMQAACGCDGTRTPHCYECSDSTWDHECPDPVPCRHRAAESALARVLPDLLDAAAAERDALAAKVERVRALHFGEYVEDEDQNRCFECGDDWPCPTIRALDEEPQP